jgi:multisubunit Na+/H+ antiporter MnhG subunit
MIGNTLIWTGLGLMMAGTSLAIFEKGFLGKLHRMGASDFSGAALVFIGIVLNGVEPLKTLLSLVFLSIWSPMITHTLAKLYVSRVKR